MTKSINVTLLIFYCSFIFWLSSRTSIPTPMIFMHQDKVFHMGAYFILGIFAWRFFKGYISKSIPLFIASLCFSSVYGLSDEFHQSFVPGREADLLDWVADTFGALIAISMLNHFKTLKKVQL